MSLISYKNDPALKAMLVEEIRKHREADQIIQGQYGRNEGGSWKGCAVGCSIHSINLKLGKDYEYSDHSAYERELGIPEWLAQVEDRIFEKLPIADAILWPEQFAEAIPVGVNLDSVKWPFLLFLTQENKELVRRLDIPDDLKNTVCLAIEKVEKCVASIDETRHWNNPTAAQAAEAAEAAEAARAAAWAAEAAAWAAEAAEAARAAWAAWAAEAARAAWAAWAAEAAQAAWAAEAAQAAWAAEAARAAAEAARAAAWAAEAARAARAAAWAAEAAEAAARAAEAAEAAAQAAEAAWAARVAEAVEEKEQGVQRYAAKLIQLLQGTANNK